ncbi:MAG: transcriptional repressor [Ignavibacteria bacterium]|nr:transcriptional repressor [Ignavibacteria bacterium]
MTFEEIKNTFIAYLKDNAHRITNERFLILNAALNMEEHFDADELYLKMKNDYLNVSRATVYKTLELMSECEILTKHNFKGDRTRYETKIGRKPHYHLICVNCNKIIEFEYPQIEKIHSSHRLMEIGFTPGQEIEMLNKTLFNDPIAFSIRGSIIAIRKNEAASIII